MDDERIITPSNKSVPPHLKNEVTSPQNRGDPPLKNEAGINVYQDNINNTPKAPRGGVRQNEPKSAPAWKPERFAGLWSFYPKAGRKKRQSAIAAWEKLHPDDELIDQIAKALKTQRSSDEWQRGIGIPYLSTYLNQRRWEEADEPEDEEPFEEVAYGWR